MEDLGPPIHNSIVEIVADMFDFLQVCASSIVWGKNVSLCKATVSRKCM